MVALISSVLGALRAHHIIDFTVLTVALYWTLRWASRARAARIALTALSLYIASLAAYRFDLVITSWVLETAAVLVGLSILLIFQRELRSALLRLDSVFSATPAPPTQSTGEALAESAFQLANKRIGALMVIPGHDALDEITSRGTPFGGLATPEVITSVFQKNSPLHDGAAIIEGDHISRVNVVLPLTRATGLPLEFGTRHRAALGLAENSDALVLVVSEESGQVRLVSRGEMRIALRSDELADQLRTWHRRDSPTWWTRAKRALTADLRLKASAVLAGAVIWVFTFLNPAIAVRTVRVGLEFSGVPAGMRVVDQSAARIDVELRGPAWLLDSVNPDIVVAHVDLSGISAGQSAITLSRDNLELPPGIDVDYFTPATVGVRLENVGGHHQSS